MDKVQVKNIGSAPWRGRDYDHIELSLDPGETVEMTERRAEQLLDDYPRAFERVGPTSGPAGDQPAADPAPFVSAPHVFEGETGTTEAAIEPKPEAIVEIASAHDPACAAPLVPAATDGVGAESATQAPPARPARRRSRGGKAK